MIAPPDALVSLLKPWADFYGDSKITETVVLFGHIGGMLVAGGIAIAADRSTLRAVAGADADRQRQLGELGAIHRVVIPALVVTLVAGAFLFAADIEAFWASWIFWVKMAMVAALLVNGLRMQSIERRIAADATADARSAGWNSLRGSAVTSLCLWLAIAFAGVALANFA